MKKIIPFVIVIAVIFVAFYVIKIKKSSNEVFVPAVEQLTVNIDEQFVVEKYISENIKTLAPEQPVLGGSWYIIGVSVNTVGKNGAVVYEDGHIQGTAIFKYNLNGGNVVIENMNAISTNDKYIHPLKWPPMVKVIDKAFVCDADLVNGYCITKVNEGAAGSTYTEYSYAKAYDAKTAMLNFTVQSVQCLNYDEPNQSECIAKQANYDLAPIADILLGGFK
jgi:hypothetical protein